LALPLPALAAPARIAYLDKGDVWVITPGRSGVERQTRTGKVEDFRFSPDGQYLAYANRLRRHEERPICSIIIAKVSTGTVIKELRPDDGWIDIDKWLGSTLLYHASSAGEVSGFFEFDAAHVVGRPLDPGDAHTLDTALSRDGQVRAYIDDVGLGPTFQERLHLVNTVSGADAVVASTRSVMAPAFSPQHDAVAFIEVAGDGSGARDRLWIYRTGDRNLTMISDDPVAAKTAGEGPQWSPDGRYLAVNFGSRLSVRAIDGGAASRQLRGADACWVNATTIVMRDADGIQQVDVATGSPQLVVRNGTRPQCLP
jgi:dipeptidyl aminopeptidase/acylaminoacyl peptidase